MIGKDAKHISENQSQDHILGYCLVNDVSEREWQIEKLGQWVKGKSHDTYRSNRTLSWLPKMKSKM